MMTQTRVYDFSEQLALGEEQEARLDRLFGHTHAVYGVPMRDQRQGIDRRMMAPSGNEYGVEYKADFLAHRTGNVYIETLSASSTGKLGWAYASRADVLVYLVVATGEVLVMPMVEVRDWVPAWLEHHREVSVNNDTYHGRGLLVPIDEVRPLSMSIARIMP